jgi:hypothetical protein
MSFLILGLCIGLLPALIIALVTTRNSSSRIATMRERLAAEEASKRHFMDLTNRHEATIALMYQEQKRLEVELARREGAAESMAA